MPIPTHSKEVWRMRWRLEVGLRLQIMGFLEVKEKMDLVLVAMVGMPRLGKVDKRMAMKERPSRLSYHHDLLLRMVFQVRKKSSFLNPRHHEGN